MSRILRRPMFRGGGKVSSYGNGIASGLADGGRVGYETGGNILKQAMDANTALQLWNLNRGPEKLKIFGKEIPGTGQALDKDGQPYDPKYVQEQLKGTRDEINSMLGFLPVGRSLRGLNMLRSGLGTARSGLPSASKVKDFFTKSPLSKSKEIGPYKPQPIGTDAWLASKIRPAFQNTGAALKDMLGGAGKLKDYKSAIGIGGIGGGYGLAKGYDAWKERQQGQELNKILEEQIKDKGNPSNEAENNPGKEINVDINTGEPTESRKDMLKRKAKEYQDILGEGIKKDSIFDAMVEGGSRIYEGEGWGSAVRAANKALDPIQNIKTASRKLALEEDIAVNKALAVAAAKDTETAKKIRALKEGGYTPREIADALAGKKAKDLNDYVKNAGSAGYLQFVNEQINPESVIVGVEEIGDVDTAKLKDGIHYIKDAFVLIEVKGGRLKGQPKYLR